MKLLYILIPLALAFGCATTDPVKPEPQKTPLEKGYTEPWDGE